MIDALISVILTVSDAQIEAGSVPVSITITNISKSDVLVANRFAVMPRMGDLEFIVTKDNQQLPFRLRVRLAPMMSENMVVLKASECITHSLTLKKEYDFSKPGIYEMYVIYRVAETPVGFQVPKIPIASEGVASPKISFKVK
jgi:hypothetical protein